MRITTGQAKGHKIKVPRGTHVRPTKDIVRQAVFSILADSVRRAQIADFFAGSGALGLEALSRGAKFCDFVDIHPACGQIIIENLNHTALKVRGRVYLQRVESFIKQTPNNRYDLIFADPPYNYPHLEDLLTKMIKVLKPGGAIIIEHNKLVKFKARIETLKVLDTRKYGDTVVTIMQKSRKEEVDNQ